MWTKLFTLCCLAFITTNVQAQTIVFPYSSSVITVDGQLTTQEWQNAATLAIPVNSTDTVHVLYQYDNNAMHFAFYGKLESASALFPELLFDPGFKRGGLWETGQWWLHVSATDCESEGAYGVYNNCALTQPGWEAGPNFTPGAPMTDTVEITVPFAKIGFNPTTQDSLGIGFLVTNTATIFQLFPAEAERLIPSTWAKAVFASANAVYGVPVKPAVSMYPNPGSGIIKFLCPEPIHRIEIFNNVGAKVYAADVDTPEASADLSMLPRGVYNYVVTLLASRVTGTLLID